MDGSAPSSPGGRSPARSAVTIAFFLVFFLMILSVFSTCRVRGRPVQFRSNSGPSFRGMGIQDGAFPGMRDDEALEQLFETIERQTRGRR